MKGPLKSKPEPTATKDNRALTKGPELLIQ